MTKNKLLTLAIALTFTFAAATAWAAPTIEAVSYGNGLGFATDFTYGTAWIKVSGPNDYNERFSVTSADDLSFVFDRSVADGNYSWEIVAVAPISADVQAKLDKASQAGDRGIASRLHETGELRAETFSGSFKVRGGSVELPVANVGGGDLDGGLKAQVFTTDLIVEGSTCVGIDCNTSESFGADTIRLKENNLRIHFDDTSNSGSFPSNDWRIVANDNSNGGESYLAIEDATAGRYPFRVEAGAQNHNLYVEADGDVGIKTRDPVVDLHIVEGNTPTVRLDQDGSDGFASQIWDLAGNESNFFIRDVTNGSKLSFRIKPSAPEDSIFIDADGDLGFGTDTPKAPMHLLASGSAHTPSNTATVALFQNNAAADDGAIVSILAGNGNANAQLWFGDADNDKAGRVIYRNQSDAISFWTNGGERLFIDSSGNICLGCSDTTGDAILHSNGAHLTSGGVWTNASSRSLKEDISGLSAEAAMATLAGLEPVTYRYLTEHDETYVGFIAEDVPDLVAMKDRKSLNSMDVVAVLTKVVQEQQKAIEALTRRLESAPVTE